VSTVAGGQSVPIRPNIVAPSRSPAVIPIPSSTPSSSNQQATATKGGQVALKVIQFIGWGACLVGLAYGGLTAIVGESIAETAIQEAALFALVACIFIGSYVFARIVEKICNLISRK
jgi:hypothetical protein